MDNPGGVNSPRGRITFGVSTGEIYVLTNNSKVNTMKKKKPKFVSNLRLSIGFALFVRCGGDVPAPKAIVPALYWSVRMADRVLSTTNIIRNLLKPILLHTPLGIAFLVTRFALDLALAASHVEMKDIGEPARQTGSGGEQK